VPELAVDAGCPDPVISNASGAASGTQSAGIYTQVSFSDLNPWCNLSSRRRVAARAPGLRIRERSICQSFRLSKPFDRDRPVHHLQAALGT
jgi:hypothetical protein